MIDSSAESRPTGAPSASSSPVPHTPRRVAVWTAPGHSEIRTCEWPSPGPRQVLVRLHGCGVCSSNVPVWEGRPWFEYPLAPGAPGHEGWGVIAAIGEEVLQLAVGQPVAVLSNAAYADFALVDATHVVSLPQELAGAALPGEPLACAYNVFRRSDVRPGTRVAIVGIGFLGAILVRLCATAGAAVAAISRRPFAQGMALLQGAHLVLGDDMHAVQREISEWTEGRGCDVVIEATGAQQPLTLAGELVATRGRLVIAGYHQDGLRHVDMQSWNWRGIDVINAHERDPSIYVEGMRLALGAIASGNLDTRHLFTHRYALEQLPEAIEMARRRPDGFLKALILTAA